MPEVHSTEDNLPGATGIVGIFPSPCSQFAYFPVEKVSI